ncbi:MAG: hypothetical protein ACR2FM_04045 [Candidatus Saccharimonadales bacterium]
MAAKQKASDKNDAIDPYLESSKDPELEKKVDAMLSMESPTEVDPDEENGAPALPSKKQSIPVLHDEADEEIPLESIEESSVDSATPLLPEELAPDDPEEEPLDAIEAPPAEVESVADEPQKDELGLEEDSTAHAVDEIIASEADELLSAHDRELEAAAELPTKSHASAAVKKPNLFKRWWRSKRVRNSTLVVLLLALIGAAAFPTSRYFVLNTAGVRSAASLTVLDETTGQPLKNAEFSIGTNSGKTDNEGAIKLANLRLGPQTLAIKKAAFADVSQPVTLGWGSNPLGEFRLKAVGSQYNITVTDFISGKPVAKVAAKSGEADARANEKGEIVLTVPVSDVDQEAIEVQLTGEGLRTETIRPALGKKDTQAVKMVPDRKHVFISKRSGTFDVYKVDVDGKNEEKVLSGTGSERPESIALSIHPTKNIAALVSSRDNSKNKDGFTLSDLTIIDLNDNTTSKATQSERVQLIGWIDNKLTYVKIAEGASAASQDRHRLISYDLEGQTEKELVSTNYFNDILAVDKSIYYTPAAYNVNGSVGLFKISSDGSNKKMVYDKEVWNLFRTSYDKISASIGQEWFDLNLNTDVMTRVSAAPPILKTRVYVNNSDSSFSLWTDERDGKGVLLNYNLAEKTDNVLQSQSGLKNPVHWLTGKHVVYRVSNNQETADYILNTEGGQPQKIRDVTDTAGIDRWYYY